MNRHTSEATTRVDTNALITCIHTHAKADNVSHTYRFSALPPQYNPPWGHVHIVPLPSSILSSPMIPPLNFTT